MDWFEAIVKIEVNRENYEFKIVHNFKNQFDEALDSWIARTKSYTAKSFCKYIESKNTEYIAIEEKTYKKIKNN